MRNIQKPILLLIPITTPLLFPSSLFFPFSLFPFLRSFSFFQFSKAGFAVFNHLLLLFCTFSLLFSAHFLPLLAILLLLFPFWLSSPHPFFFLSVQHPSQLFLQPPLLPPPLLFLPHLRHSPLISLPQHRMKRLLVVRNLRYR